MSRNSYFTSPGLNCSSLKTIWRNPKWFKYQEDNPETEDEEKRHYRIGSAIDSILTTPNEFNQEFAVSYKERPGGNMGVFIDALPLDLNSESDGEEYREAYDKAGYKLSLETVIKNLWGIEKYKTYYLSRKNAKGRSIISYDEYEEVLHCKDYLLGNPYTREYFINNNPEESVYHQVAIYFNVMLKDLERSNDALYWISVACKALLDGIRINHKNKTIQPFDLKTTGRSVLGFKNVYMFLGYYLQASFYELAVRQSINDTNGQPDWLSAEDKLRGINLSDYEILPMQFIVTEKKTSMSNPARIFACSKNDIEAGQIGGVYNGEYYPGYIELIYSYLWHRDTNYWELPKTLVDSKGVVNLDTFEKVHNGTNEDNSVPLTDIGDYD